MMTVNFGTLAQATAVTILAPSLAMPPRSRTCVPTMKPVMFCRNTSGTPRWLQSSMKCAPFERRLGEQDAVVGDDADRACQQMCAKPQTRRRAVERLELVEIGAVDDAGDDLAHVVAACACRAARRRKVPRHG